MYSENLRREISWTIKLSQIHKIYIPQCYHMFGMSPYVIHVQLHVNYCVLPLVSK